jgi:hypothetical protein
MSRAKMPKRNLMGMMMINRRAMVMTSMMILMIIRSKWILMLMQERIAGFKLQV